MKKAIKILLISGVIAAGVGIGSVLVLAFTQQFVDDRVNDPITVAPAEVASPKPTLTRDDLLNETNKYRSDLLSLDSTLNNTAQEKCDEIIKSGVFEHGDIEIDKRKAGRSYFGENLAEGYTTSVSAVDAWINSPGHYANLVRPQFHRVGFGICSSSILGQIVVQHFSD